MISKSKASFVVVIQSVSISFFGVCVTLARASYPRHFAQVFGYEKGRRVCFGIALHFSPLSRSTGSLISQARRVSHSPVLSQMAEPVRNALRLSLFLELSSPSCSPPIAVMQKKLKLEKFVIFLFSFLPSFPTISIPPMRVVQGCHSLTSKDYLQISAPAADASLQCTVISPRLINEMAWQNGLTPYNLTQLENNIRLLHLFTFASSRQFQIFHSSFPSSSHCQIPTPDKGSLSHDRHH